MTKVQFRVLYRQFLFRVIDLELLSSQGEISKLLGQIAALLVFFSLLVSFGVWALAGSHMRTPALLIGSWGMEHFLIATTMLAVGLFAVLSWDSMFPDRRDVLVLAPLPVRARTVFLAKVAAVATALGVMVAALNVLTGLPAPLAFSPLNSGVLGLARSFAAYWVTMLTAGTFIFCCLLGIQGLAAQILPHRQFLRMSSFLQMAAFCLLVGVYFLQPPLATPQALTAAQNQGWLACLPSYWFLGLFQELNGSMRPALTPLAWRAWIGLGIATCIATLAYLLSYFRTLRKIVEEPDIVPRSRGARWLPRFGDPLQTAIGQFSVRTLFRSRQHRLILAFYSGIGFALVIFWVKTPYAQEQLSAASVGSLWHQLNAPLLAASIVMMFFWVVGIRATFAMPLELRANWIFRITALGGVTEYLAASRRAFYALAVFPVLAASAAVFPSLWPCWPALGHLVILGLLGLILCDLCLAGFQKIPFACSYLPGKSNVTRAFWLCIFVFILLVAKGSELERRALERPAGYAIMLAILVVAMVCSRWRTTAIAKSGGARLQFEELPPPAVQILGLHLDRM